MLHVVWRHHPLAHRVPLFLPPESSKHINTLWSLLQRYQDAPGVEHIPVVQIDLSVPLKVPGKCLLVEVHVWDVMESQASLSSSHPMSSQACPCQTST